MFRQDLSFNVKRKFPVCSSNFNRLYHDPSHDLEKAALFVSDFSRFFVTLRPNYTFCGQTQVCLPLNMIHRGNNVFNITMLSHILGQATVACLLGNNS